MIIGVLAALGGCAQPVPSDAQLLATFRVNREGFEELRDRALRSNQTRIERDQLSLMVRGPGDREKVMSRVVDDAAISLIQVARLQNGERVVSFSMASSGLATGGTVKGIEWHNRPPKHLPILASLDDPSDPRGFVTRSWFNALRPLDNGWYLFLSKD